MTRFLLLLTGGLLAGACSAEPPTVCDQASDFLQRKFERSHDSADKFIYETAFGSGALSPEQLLSPGNSFAKTEALSVLAITGRAERLEYLLKLGIDPNSRTKDNVPLIVAAAACKRTASVNVLIAAGADIYAHDKEAVDAMGASIIEDAKPIVDSLTAAGYVVDSKSIQGRMNLRLAKTMHGGKYESALNRE